MADLLPRGVSAVTGVGQPPSAETDDMPARWAPNPPSRFHALHKDKRHVTQGLRWAAGNLNFPELAI